MTQQQRQSSGDIAVYERPDRFDIYRFETAADSRDLFEQFVASEFTRDEALQKARALADDRTVFWRDVSGVVRTIKCAMLPEVPRTTNSLRRRVAPR